MRFWVSGPRIGFFRPGISFGSGYARRPMQRQYVQQARPRGDFVYVIESANNTVKIGYSSNPEARLATLQTGSGFPLSLSYVAATRDAAAVEGRAHELLARHRLQGEWFDTTADAAVAAIHMAGHQIGVEVNQSFDEDFQTEQPGNHKLGMLMVSLFLLACWIVWQVSTHPTPMQH